MSIPQKVLTELSELQAQVAAAYPIQSAPQQTVIAIQLNAQQLVADIETALIGAAGALDTWTAPADPVAIASGLLGLLENAKDQANLAQWAGYVGRATKNVDQLVP
jgi:hypothetical protein